MHFNTPLNLYPQPLSLDSFPLFVPSELMFPRVPCLSLVNALVYPPGKYPFSRPLHCPSPKTSKLKTNSILIISYSYFLLDSQQILLTQMDQDQILYPLPQSCFSFWALCLLNYFYIYAIANLEANLFLISHLCSPLPPYRLPGHQCLSCLF